jgi:hypothetical protein
MLAKKILKPSRKMDKWTGSQKKYYEPIGYCKGTLI